MLITGTIKAVVLSIITSLTVQSSANIYTTLKPEDPQKRRERMQELSYPKGKPLPSSPDAPSLNTDRKEFYSRLLTQCVDAIQLEKVSPKQLEEFSLLAQKACDTAALLPDRDMEEFKILGEELVQKESDGKTSPTLQVLGQYFLSVHGSKRTAADDLPSSKKIGKHPILIRALWNLVKARGDRNTKKRGDYLKKFADRIKSFCGDTPSPDVEVFIAEEIRLMHKSRHEPMQRLKYLQKDKNWKWLGYLAEGYYELGAAWDSRGDGFSSTVSETGWKGWDEHCTKAEKALKKSYELRPDLPFAAASMIEAGRGTGISDEQSREWFDRAVAARLDFQRAYELFSWFILEPRWGGNRTWNKLFALECMDNPRSDTIVPLHGLCEMRQLGFYEPRYRDWRLQFCNPELMKYVDKAFAGVLASPQHEPYKTRLKVQYAIMKLWAGRSKEAQEDLAAIPEAKDLIWQAIPCSSKLTMYHRTWQQLTDEIQALEGEYGTKIREGIKLISEGHKNKGIKLWMKTLKECRDKSPETTRHLLDRCAYALSDAEWENGHAGDLRFGDSPLNYVLNTKEYKLAKWLISNGADVNFMPPYKDACATIGRMVSWREPEAVKFLLEHGANPNLMGPGDNLSALSFAILRKDLPSAKLLIEKGADLNLAGKGGQTPLMTAVRWDFMDEMKFILEQKGVDLNAKEKYQRTALHLAIRNDNFAMAEMLLEKGADFKTIDKYNETPFYAACRMGNAAIAAALIEKGANVNATCHKENWTPLIIATRRGHTDVAKLLLEHDADPNAILTTRFTCLYYAAYYNRTEIVRMLLEKGAKVDTLNHNWDWTALIGACYRGNYDVVKLLIEAGADVNMADNRGMDAIYTAAHDKHPEILKLLVEHGADPNRNIFREKWSPIKASAHDKMTATVKLLLELGADPTRKIQGRNAFDEVDKDSEIYKMMAEYIKLHPPKPAPKKEETPKPLDTREVF